MAKMIIAKRLRVVASKTDWLIICKSAKISVMSWFLGCFSLKKNFTVFPTLLHFLAHMCGEGIDSRDSLSFGKDKGFHDPLIHYLGGGAKHPPGFTDSELLACYGMEGELVKEYYMKGMLLNHSNILAHRPYYVDEVC